MWFVNYPRHVTSRHGKPTCKQADVQVGRHAGRWSAGRQSAGRVQADMQGGMQASRCESRHVGRQICRQVDIMQASRHAGKQTCRQVCRELSRYYGSNLHFSH